MAHPSALPTAQDPIGLPVISLRELVPWAVLVVLLALLLLYLVGAEQGALALTSGSQLHEFLHDGRHLLGVPCH